jgi:hypothetical protein
MRLARGERERLWKGLERFVNCGNGLNDFVALGRAFGTFWPIDVRYHPLRKPLTWNPVCHKLFLFYREVLRRIWCGLDRGDDFPSNPSNFLLGLEEDHKQAIEAAKPDANQVRNQILAPASSKLISGWTDVLKAFPSANAQGVNRVQARWPDGEFLIFPQNDFHRAFYLLFRQSWRARKCSRCSMFFIARKPKQRFCGTACSAGSRLASKRRWWNRVGTKKRTHQHLPDRKERKPR